MGTGTAFAEDAKENIVVSSIKDTDSKKYDACCAEGVFKFYGEPEKDWAAGRALWWPVLAGRCLGLTNWRIYSRNEQEGNIHSSQLPM